MHIHAGISSIKSYKILIDEAKIGEVSVCVFLILSES